uniref:RING-type domain-containing protein n=1 Tax=Strigamia maritima TaxID=126957 RepID=T1J8C3_STRMM
MEISGRKKGCSNFTVKGYIFRVYSSKGETQYCRCIVDDCPSRAIRKDGEFNIKKPHNHLVLANDIDRRQLESNCKKRAAETTTPFSEIVEDESRRFPNAAHMVAFGSIESTLARHRRGSQPAIPGDAQMFNDLLQQHPLYSTTLHEKPFFRNILTALDGSISIVFAGDELLNALQTTTSLHIDGTFKVSPYLFMQFCTLHAFAFDYAFPAIYVLMTHKTQAANECLLRYVLELQPNLNPTVVMSDFETALQNAVSICFPQARVAGCFFHYSQAIWRRVQKLGLTDGYRDNPRITRTVKRCMALSLLPHTSIVAGLQTIREYTRLQGIDSGTVQSLLLYIECRWIRIITPERFSVFDLIRRTNNDVESFHKTLLKRIGLSHPNIWEFMVKLIYIEDKTRLDLERADDAMRIRRAKKKVYILNNIHIINAQAKLNSGEIRIDKYLRTVAHDIPELSTNDTMVENVDDEIDVNVVDDVIDDVVDNMVDNVVENVVEDVGFVVHNVIENVVEEVAFVVDNVIPVRGRGRGRGQRRGTPRGGGRGVVRATSDVSDLSEPPSPPVRRRGRGRPRRGGRGRGNDPQAPETPQVAATTQVPRPLCIICVDTVANTVLVPCGHLFTCYDCAGMLMDRNQTCPNCRGEIVLRVRTFTGIED